MKNLFTPAKEYNLSLQTRAKELNVRAGEKIFPVYTKEEMKAFLSDKLNGAVNLQTVPDMEALKLPGLDEALILTTEQSNPLMIVIADSECSVAYTHSWNTYYAKATIEEAVARTVEAGTKVEHGSLEGDQEGLQLLTPGGRVLTLISNGVEATTFQELVQKLEEKRIERAWSDKKSELEHTSSWISNPTDVFPKLSSILNKVEITKTDNGDGESVFGWVYLHSDPDPDFKVLLTDNEDEAQEQTKLGLKRLLAKATKEDRKVPQEMPWFDKSKGWNGEKTELGNALATAVESLPEQFIPETPAEAEKAIELLRVRIAEIKVKLAGAFEEAHQKIQSVREQIEEIQDAEYAEDELNEIRDLLNQAETLMKSGNTDEAMVEQGKAEALVAAIPATVTERKVAETDFNTVGDQLNEDDLLYNLRNQYGDYRHANEFESELARKYDDEIWSLKHAKKFAEAKALAEKVLQAAQSAKARAEAINAHLDDEYRKCPVSNQELDGNIWLSGEDAEKVRLFNGGEYGETVVLKSSHIGEMTFVELKAEFNDRYDEYEVSLHIVSENWEDGAQVEVKTLFTPPTEEAAQAASKVTDLKRQLAYVEEEMERSDRIVLKFQKTDYRGKPSLQVSDFFDGGRALFVVNHHMMDDVNPGEEWICSVGREIGTTGKGYPILVANPQSQNNLDELKRKLQQAEQHLADVMAGVVTEKVEVVEEQEEEGISQESLQALLEKFGK